MTHDYDPDLHNLFVAIAKNLEAALEDPRIPILPELKEEAVDEFEFLAAKLTEDWGPEDTPNWRHHVETEIYDLVDLLGCILDGRGPYDFHDGYFPFEENLSRVVEVFERGIFIDPGACTKTPVDLAKAITLQIVRRSMEIRTGRQAVVTGYDERVACDLSGKRPKQT
jgi:hypothetical protein